MNKQTITSICSIAALSAAMIIPAYAAITVTPTSLDVNFNDAADTTDDTTLKYFGTWNGYMGHNPTGGINSDGAMNFNGNFRAVNWRQGLTGEVGTTITQSLVFTDNNLASSYIDKVAFIMGFTNNVTSHVADATAGSGGSDTADALQFQLYHSLSNGNISTTLRPVVDGMANSNNTQQAYNSFAYTGTNMLQFDLTLTRTGTDTFDWSYVVTDLDAGSSVVGSDTQSLTSADFGTSLNVGGVYASMRSGNQTAGLLSGLDQWSVNVNVVPEPSAYALLAGALALGLVMIRRRRS